MAKNSYRAKSYPRKEAIINLEEHIPVQLEPETVEITTKPVKIGLAPVLYKVRVNHPSLRRREEPTLEGKILGLITDKGIYDIYAETSGWGKLQDNSWIKLEFCQKIKE